MFNWLDNLIEKILSIFPSVQLVSPDEYGVRITLGKYVSDAPPGWYVLWPVIQEYSGLKVKTQIKDLRAQSVWSADHKELTISGAVKYYVANVRKALFEVYDYDANVQALALGIIQRHCAAHEEMTIKTSALEGDILEILRKESQGWGLKIEKVYITDIGRTRNIRLLTNTASEREII